MRLAAAAALAFALAAPAAASGGFDSIERMRATIIDKPLRGAILGDDFKTIDNRFVEQYYPDGSFTGWYLDGEPGRYDGKWAFRPVGNFGDGICFDFFDGNKEQCYLVRVTGKVLEFFNEEGRFIAVAAIEDQPAPELEALKKK